MTTPHGEPIGLVGLMGARVGRNLAAAGRRLTIFDQRDDVVAEVARETGAIAAADLHELLARSTTLITILPDGPAVRTVPTAAGGKDPAGLRPLVPKG